MALETYSDLVVTVADWLARDDITSRTPDFVLIAEARINRELRVREMVAQETGTASAQDLAIPADLVEVLLFTIDTTSSTPLEYRPAEDSALRVAAEISGTPKWFSVVGSNFRLYPARDGSYAYTLDYYAKVETISYDNEKNWLLTKAPDIYLYAALKEAADFLFEPEKAALWESRFQATKRSLHGAEARSKRTSGPRRARVLV